MFCSLPIASGEVLSGSLTYTPSVLDSGDGVRVIGDPWPNYTATMTWEVTNEDNTWPGFPWKYTYSFGLTTTNGTLQGGISHIIIECSEALSEVDIAGVSGGVVFDDDPVELQKTGPGNPGMPEDIWGIKFDPISIPVSEYEMTWSFWSNREPVWGDFYVKDGNNIAYNYNVTETVETGFLSPDSDPDVPRSSDPAGLYHILRPDSHVPEPGSFVLLVTAAVGLLGCAWRRKRRYW